MHQLETARRSSYAPRDRRGLAEWARGIKLPAAYSFKGRFDPDLSPWLKRAFDACGDSFVRELTCISAVRTGKTLVGDLFLAWKAATDPGPTMFNIGTDADAKEHGKLRFVPLLKSIPAVKAKFSDNRHDLTESLVKFMDGTYILIQGLTNPNNFDAKGIRWEVNDEGHKAPPGNIDKAKSRTADFRHNCKVINISQGGTVNDDMDVAYRRGTMEVFGWKCPECQTLQPYEWRDRREQFRIKWDKNETTCPGGRWDFDEMAKTIRYECANPDCNFVVRDNPEERRRQTYEYSQFLPPANPLAPRDNVSCTWNQLCVPWIPWREIVIDWIEAMSALESGDMTKLKNFIQRRLAQSYEESEARPQQNEEHTSDYISTDPWPDEHRRYMTADVQEKGGRYFLAAIRAFAIDGRSRLLWAGRLETYEEIRQKQLDFAIEGMRVGLDSAHETSEVQGMCARYGWISLLGQDEGSWAHSDPNGNSPLQKPYSVPKKVWVGLGTKDQAQRRFVWHFLWSNPTFKDICHRRSIGKGLYYGVPADIEELSTYTNPNNGKATSYWPQMRANQKIRKKDKTTGREQVIWTRIGERPDHYLDCERMLLVMAAIEGCLGGEAIQADSTE
jgi:hypothetical protein